MLAIDDLGGISKVTLGRLLVAGCLCYQSPCHIGIFHSLIHGRKIVSLVSLYHDEL